MYTYKYDATTKRWMVKNPRGRVIIPNVTWRVAKATAEDKTLAYQMRKNKVQVCR